MDIYKIELNGFKRIEYCYNRLAIVVQNLTLIGFDPATNDHPTILVRDPQLVRETDLSWFMGRQRTTTLPSQCGTYDLQYSKIP
jgi:hypothetical protein